MLQGVAMGCYRLNQQPRAVTQSVTANGRSRLGAVGQVLQPIDSCCRNRPFVKRRHRAMSRAVHEAKVKLAEFRGRHQLSCIHIYIKAPTVLAVALDHRLNGIGVIQLYDWDLGKYRQTVRL